MAEFALLPAHTALINVDMQNCFVEDSPLAPPDGRELVETINGLIRTCRETGVLVVHTRGWMAKDGSDLGIVAGLVPPFIIELYTAGAPTAELHSALDVAPNDLVMTRPATAPSTGPTSSTYYASAESTPSSSAASPPTSAARPPHERRPSMTSASCSSATPPQPGR